MKTSQISLIALLVLTVCEAFSQPTERKGEVIQTLPIEVTFNKTTSIIFPAVIKSVDRGSKDILAQKAKGVGNVLQLKAGKDSFPETNLTVITADGTLHHFTVSYSTEPVTQTVDISHPAISTSLIFQTELTESDMENYAKGIILAKRTILFNSESQYKVSLALLGIYVKGDVMFYRFKIFNHSHIDYDIDFLKFYIRDKARIKRTASQEIEIKPIYVFGNGETVKGGSSNDLVYALQKFTIPESKHLDIELFEKNGGRHFELVIKNKTIVKARLLE
jgi:conjugative transposon TraN protein